MPLPEDQEHVEHLLRVDQMTVNIEKMRSDMAFQQTQLQKQLAWEMRKFIVSVVLAAAALFGAGAAVGTYVTRQSHPIPVEAATSPPQK